tara:strand:- start:568 stop:864 length:297 start_codon:yes stop_codon:yes gene_type:complete
MVGRPLHSKRCGAYARSTGLPCKAKALKNGRCRNHGGLSDWNAKTAQGKYKAILNLKNVKRETIEHYRKIAEGGSSFQDMQGQGHASSNDSLQLDERR